MQKIKFITKNLGQTKKIGEILAKNILKSQLKTKKAIILGLIGDLGSGKTTFLQGFARGLGIKEKILSPTFIILKRFKVKRRTFKNFYHIDCYRLQKASDLSKLGLKKALCDSENIIAIEWAEKIKKTLPKNIIIIKAKFVNLKIRQITIKSFYPISFK